MRVLLKFKDKELIKHHNLYIEFVKFLQENYPLKYDFSIYFLKDRIGQMSTGSRTDNHELKILTGGRLNRDILRTLAHEWIHEYQMTILKREKGPDIGGQNEDEANAISARLIKMFEKKFPSEEKLMYERKKGIS